MLKLGSVGVLGIAAVVLLGSGRPDAAVQATSEIALARESGDRSEIVLVPEKGGQGRTLVTGGEADAGPSFSPNGNRLVFASSREGTWDLFILTLPEKVSRLTRDAGSEFDPQWSPDGKSIAYERTVDGQRDVYVVPAQGGPVTDVSKSLASDLDPAWIPGTREIVFESDRSGSFDLYRTSIGGRARSLTSGSSQDFHPAVSPDGATVAFERAVHGNYDIYLLSLKTRKLTRVVGGPAEDAEPAWSPDGTKLAFVSTLAGQYDVYTLMLTTRKITNVTRSADSDEIAPVWRLGGAALLAALPRWLSVAAGVTCPIGPPYLGTNVRNVIAVSPSTSTIGVTICGKGGNDDLTGGAGNDLLLGDPGLDRMAGLAGDDALYGGANYAGLGADHLLGGSGNDRLYARGDAARDCIWGGLGGADHARLDGGLDNVSPGPNRVPAWLVTPCGDSASIEAFD